MFYPTTIVTLLLISETSCLSFHSGFNGKALYDNRDPMAKVVCSFDDTLLTMRKQKASDKRTTRRQRNQVLESSSSSSTITVNIPVTPLESGSWKQKTLSNVTNLGRENAIKGRGRSRKRETLYSNLSSYNNHFLELLTAEFLTEVIIENIPHF